MFNSVILVGRLVEKPIIRQLDTGLSVTTITLAVIRPFKNSDGNYETDFIKCTLWEGIAEATCEYCTKGSVIGIKGRIIAKTVEIGHDENKKNIRTLELIAERVSFIQLSKEKEVDDL